jgi:hypothetical protein
VQSKTALDNLDSVELSKLVVQLLKGDVSAMTILDNIKDETISNWSTNIIDTGKRYLSNNYEKNKICDRINHGGLVIGDDVLNHTISLAELVIELDKLSTEHIKDYVGEQSMIDFSTTERQIGYLKSHEGLPVTKILMPSGQFYTLTKYKDETYLLFTISGKHELYGISFPAGFRGSRKLVVFEIPENLDYKLEIN